MSRGGARNRSGPGKVENSGRSDRAGYSLTALPAEGYDGPIPRFPLPRRIPKDGENDTVSDRVHRREGALWRWLWRTPQACAWAMPSEAWRLHTIAMYVRTFVICEGPDATAADKGSLHRFADQIGMTTAGLAEMGWKVAVDQLAERRGSQGSEQPPMEAEDDDDRLRDA